MLNTKQFTYDPKDRMFSIFISDFEPIFQLTPVIELQSEKSGRVVKFNYERTNRASSFSEDVDSWTYKAVINNFEFTMLIFND